MTETETEYLAGDRVRVFSPIGDELPGPEGDMGMGRDWEGDGVITEIHLSNYVIVTLDDGRKVGTYAAWLQMLTD